MKSPRFNFGPPVPGDWISPYPDGLPGHRGRDTEIAAAVAALRNAPENWRRAYGFIDSREERGATDIEGQDECFFSFPKRRCDLMHFSIVVDSGQRRKTPRGSLAIVWVTVRVATQEV